MILSFDFTYSNLPSAALRLLIIRKTSSLSAPVRIAAAYTAVRLYALNVPTNFEKTSIPSKFRCKPVKLFSSI